MKVIFTHLGNRILSYVLVPVIIIIGTISYYRFIVNHDYIVEYEGVCDPYTEECFVGCEDEECTQEYYYSNMHKYASDLYTQCGKDITDCEAASMCLPNDQECSIIYCNENTKDNICEILTEESNVESDIPTESLQDNNIDDTKI